ATYWTTYHYDGTAFTERPPPSSPNYWVGHLWTAPGDDLLLTAENAAYRWAEQPAPAWQPAADLGALGGSSFYRGATLFGPTSRALGWAGAYSFGAPWAGTAWTMFEPLNSSWTSGYSAGGGDVLIGGANGRLARLGATPPALEERQFEPQSKGHEVTL